MCIPTTAWLPLGGSLLVVWSPILVVIYNSILFLLFIIYLGFVYKRLYGIDVSRVAVKLLLFAVIGSFLGFLATLGAGFVLYRLGAFDSLIELNRLQREAMEAAKDSIN